MIRNISIIHGKESDVDASTRDGDPSSEPCIGELPILTGEFYYWINE